MLQKRRTAGWNADCNMFLGGRLNTYSIPSNLTWPVILCAAAAAVGSGIHELRKQTFAPHELNDRDAPAPIMREPPALPDGSINFESAEERNLRIVVVTKGLQQPWS